MSVEEVAPGVHRVVGKYVQDFGFLTSYIIIRAGEAIIIDPGTAGHPGKTIIQALDSCGLDPRRDVAAILCTHGHPDHVGGALRTHNATGAPVFIHKSDAPVLESPALFLKERLLLGPTGRLSMAFDKSPIRVNYSGIRPERELVHGERLRVGDDQLVVINTRGHSAGHCVFYMPQDRILFAGDEVCQYPSDPHRFYVDLSGDLTARLDALEALSSLDIDFLLPAHDVPYLYGDIPAQFEGAIEGVQQFQESVLRIVRARDGADVEQIVFDLTQEESVPIPLGNQFLLPTTVRVALENLRKRGAVREDKGVWSLS